MLSALYLFAYLSLGIVALVLGAVATQRGLGLAVDLGAGIITLLSLVTIGLIVTLRMSANAPAVSSSIVSPPPSAPFSGANHDKSAQSSIEP